MAELAGGLVNVSPVLDAHTHIAAFARGSADQDMDDAAMGFCSDPVSKPSDITLSPSRRNV